MLTIALVHGACVVAEPDAVTNAVRAPSRSRFADAIIEVDRY
jgi:hypothetical protein